MFRFGVWGLGFMYRWGSVLSKARSPGKTRVRVDNIGAYIPYSSY